MFKVYVHNILAEKYFNKYRNKDAPFTNVEKRTSVQRMMIETMRGDGGVLLLQECDKDTADQICGTHLCFCDFTRYEDGDARDDKGERIMKDMKGTSPMVAVCCSTFPNARLIKMVTNGNGFVAVDLGNGVGVVSVHCHWGEKNRQIQDEVAKCIAENSNIQRWLVGGDFNTDSPAIDGLENVKDFDGNASHLSNTTERSTFLTYDHVFVKGLNDVRVETDYPEWPGLLLSHGHPVEKDKKEWLGSLDCAIFHSDHAILCVTFDLTV